jgi:hypothetical protein
MLGCEDASARPACQPAVQSGALDVYGGLAAVTLPATGRFRTDHVGTRFWLVTPLGHPFFSFGINGLSPMGDLSPALGKSPYAETVTRKYPDAAAWAVGTLARLRLWGLNTLGAWSDPTSLSERMPYTVVLDVARGALPDVWDGPFMVQGWKSVLDEVLRRRDDPYLVGYFLDNELSWGPDQHGLGDLLQQMMRLPLNAPGKQKMVDLLWSRHGADAADLGRAWGISITSQADLTSRTDWPAPPTDAARADRSACIRAIADQYFTFAAGAIRAVDPSHLILGSRFVSWTLPPEVLDAASAAVDVVSVNHYEFDPLFAKVAQGLDRFIPVGSLGGAWIDEILTRTPKPVLISEFGYRADDSGLPNSMPPRMPVLRTQTERADQFEAYLARAQQEGKIVGAHWFQWVDEPATGRADGENSNWGLVDVQDQPYAALTARMACMVSHTSELLAR